MDRTEENEPFIITQDLMEAVESIRSKKFDEGSLLLSLKILLNEGKGNGNIKHYIGHNISAELVKLCGCRNKEVSLAAAKVLRSITVHKYNKKKFKEFCSVLLNHLKNATPAARIPLTAVIWNLSSVASNRQELFKANVLPMLVSALTEEGEIQSEAAGALRNFTLDEDLYPVLAQTSIIENMLSIIENNHVTDNNKLIWNILDSFENLSVYSPIHKTLARKSCLTIFSDILTDSNNPTFQKFILTIFKNILTTEEIKLRLQNNGFSLLLFGCLENFQEDSNITLCQELLFELLGENSVTRNKIRKIKMRNPNVKYTASDVEDILQQAAGCDAIKEKNIKLLSELGEGSFGSVYLAEYHNFPVAVKFLKYELDQKGVSKVVEELKVMRKLKHPNIVLLIGASVDSENRIMILTEYAPRGDLKRCLGQIHSIANRLRITRELAIGLNWCHQHYVTHRDLKLENILITENWGVKIGDFGLSIQDPEEKGWHNFRGNVKYSAPELLRQRALPEQEHKVYPYGVKTDVYSFGLLWYEILTRLSPFKDKPEEYKGREGQALYTLEGHRPVPPSDWPKTLKQIMQLCWHEDPNKRPTFTEILGIWDTISIKFLCPKDKAAQSLIRSLWKDQFKKPTYSEFKESFVKHCLASHKISPKNEILLEDICRENIINPTVTFEQFCHVVGWYGPLNAQTDCSEFFSRISEVKRQWFFRSIESDDDSDRFLRMHWEENTTTITTIKKDPTTTPHIRSNFLKPLISNDEDSQYSNFILKYYLNHIAKFELRYLDHQGQVHSALIKNLDGHLHLPGGDMTIIQWSNLNTILKHLNALHL